MIQIGRPWIFPRNHIWPAHREALGLGGLPCGSHKVWNEEALVK
jgi:hypothetical protein